MTLRNEVLPLLAAISAAFIAGAVSFIVTVLTKEQKTSEFRQAWIDALREDLANFASLAIVIYDLIKGRLRHGEDIGSIERALLQTDLADFKKVEIARLRILFRLNPKEHVNLIKTLDDIYQHTPERELKTPGLIDQLVARFTDESQRVLKSEWKRVKKGEPIFRVTKWGSLGIVIIIIVTGLISVFQQIAASNVP